MIYYQNNDEFYHHGVKGMHWGVRRYQNEDGTYTFAGRQRYGIHATSRKTEDLLDRADRATSKSERSMYVNRAKASEKFNKNVSNVRSTRTSGDKLAVALTSGINYKAYNAKRATGDDGLVGSWLGATLSSALVGAVASIPINAVLNSVPMSKGARVLATGIGSLGLAALASEITANAYANQFIKRETEK